MTYCGQFGSMMPTRSPFVTPRPASAAANRSDRRLDVAKRELGAEKRGGRTIRNLNGRGVEDLAQRAGRDTSGAAGTQ